MNLDLKKALANLYAQVSIEGNTVIVLHDDLQTLLDAYEAIARDAYREGFDDGARDAMDDERGVGGVGFNELWNSYHASLHASIAKE